MFWRHWLVTVTIRAIWQKAIRSHRQDQRQCTALCIVVYIAEGWSQAWTRARFLPAPLTPRHIRSIHRATHSVQRLWLASFLFTRPTEKESSLRKNWSGSPSVFIHKTFSPKSWKKPLSATTDFLYVTHINGLQCCMRVLHSHPWLQDSQATHPSRCLTFNFNVTTNKST
jgi:hypothetical protein